MENQGPDPNDELQDTGTSPTAVGDTMPSKEHSSHVDDVPPTNPASPSCNEFIVQDIAGGAPPHCVLLPSVIEWVRMEENAHVRTLGDICALDTIPVSIQEDATLPRPPSPARQLFRTPATVLRTSTCIPPPMHPTLVGPHPSPRVPI